MISYLNPVGFKPAIYSDRFLMSVNAAVVFSYLIPRPLAAQLWGRPSQVNTAAKRYTNSVVECQKKRAGNSIVFLLKGLCYELRGGYSSISHLALKFARAS